MQLLHRNSLSREYLAFASPLIWLQWMFFSLLLIKQDEGGACSEPILAIRINSACKKIISLGYAVSIKEDLLLCFKPQLLESE